MYLCGDCLKTLKDYRYLRAVPYASECDMCGDYESLVHEVSNVVKEEEEKRE